MMWNKGESGVYYLAISVSRGPAASETDGAGLCACELQTWPALQQLQHGFTPVTDFIANCGEPEYGEVVVIKRFNGMLGALDFDCFFFFLFFRSLLSNVRGHYYCNNKKMDYISFNWWLWVGCRTWIGFLCDHVEPVFKKNN